MYVYEHGLPFRNNDLSIWSVFRTTTIDTTKSMSTSNCRLENTVSLFLALRCPLVSLSKCISIVDDNRRSAPYCSYREVKTFCSMEAQHTMPKEIYDDVAQLKVLISHLPPLRPLFNDSSFAIHYASPFNKGIWGHGNWPTHMSYSYLQ